ncbi:MAG: DUF5108 domain-containing protein, partial [Bacteroidota bacterium]|nr:DUF5108 domain-containing protein [Bacteroidota bacterium]
DFYQKMGVSGITELGKTYARSLVKYHTVLDTISVADFVQLSYTTNLSGDQLSIAIDPNDAGEAVLGGDAKVVEMGIHVSNGLIYVLGDVMKPLVETVYDRVAQNSSYTIFTKAIEQTDWADSLNTMADTTVLDGVSKISKRYYTVLAVSDAAFAKSGIGSVSDLITKLGAGSDLTSSSNELYKYVAYHILGSAYTLEKLETFSGSDISSIWGTKAENQVLMITKDSLTVEKYFINKLGTQACFVASNCNVLAKNGYVHEIDSYLPVWEPTPATVVWDLTDYAEVRNVVGSSIYQPSAPVGTEDKINISNAPCYTAEVSASGVGGTAYSYLTYVTCKINLKSAQFYDRLVLNLGYMGSVSMRTPTLVRGKYKVTLNFIYLSDHAFMRTMSEGNGGLMKISFDGQDFKNVSPYTTVTSSLAGVYQSTLYDELDFSATTNHVFKIVVMDPAASTNSKFSLQLDCITFTPITE